MRAAVFVLTLLVGGAALAQVSGYAPGPDLSGFAKQSDVQAVQSQIPKPASTVPPSEMPGGSVGSPGTYRPADARQPRITRSRTVTLAADGTATFDWSAQGPLATPGQVVVTPVYTGAGVPKCWATAVTANSASVKCVVETVASVSVLGVGLIGSVSNAPPSGLQVGVIALPPS